jgi:NAD kinase
MMFSKIYVNCKGDYGSDIKKEVSEIIKGLGIKVCSRNRDDIDLAILIGGDGTLLREQSDIHCPILGINPGESVGYYMTANDKDFRKKAVQVLSGRHGKDYFVHNLMRLETKVNGKKMPYFALNDVLISPIYVRRILDAELIAGIRKSVERGTGILAYTPTGSVAYAGSLGARKLPWDFRRFGVTAIAPYAGRLKEGEILAEKETIRIKCLNDEGEVCVDGQEKQVLGLEKNDVIQVSKSVLPSRIVSFQETFK